MYRVLIKCPEGKCTQISGEKLILTSISQREIKPMDLHLNGKSSSFGKWLKDKQSVTTTKGEPIGSIHVLSPSLRKTYEKKMATLDKMDPKGKFWERVDQWIEEDRVKLSKKCKGLAKDGEPVHLALFGPPKQSLQDRLSKGFTPSILGSLETLFDGLMVLQAHSMVSLSLTPSSILFPSSSPKSCLMAFPAAPEELDDLLDSCPTTKDLLRLKAGVKGASKTKSKPKGSVPFLPPPEGLALLLGHPPTAKERKTYLEMFNALTPPSISPRPSHSLVLPKTLDRKTLVRGYGSFVVGMVLMAILRLSPLLYTHRDLYASLNGLANDMTVFNPLGRLALGEAKELYLDLMALHSI